MRGLPRFFLFKEKCKDCGADLCNGCGTCLYCGKYHSPDCPYFADMEVGSEADFLEDHPNMEYEISRAEYLEDR